MISILVFFFVALDDICLASWIYCLVWYLQFSLLFICPVLLLRFYDLECQIIIVLLLCGNPFVAGVGLITQAVGWWIWSRHKWSCMRQMSYMGLVLLKFCHGICVCVRARVEFWRLKLFCCGFCWGLCCRTLGNHVIAEFWWPFIFPLPIL